MTAVLSLQFSDIFERADINEVFFSKAERETVTASLFNGAPCFLTAGCRLASSDRWWIQTRTIS